MKLNSFFFSFLFMITASAQDSMVLSFDSLLLKVSANQKQYNTLSERVRLTWNDGSAEQEFLATIRTKKDSLIWLSIGMFGVEGIRTLFSVDSFFLISKMTNEYAARPFNTLQNWTLFPVTFNMLQQVIDGSKAEIKPQATAVAVEDSLYVLHEETDKMKQTTWVDTGNYTIRKILLKDKLLKQDMVITFDGYNFREDKPFSYRRSIIIHYGETTAVLNMEIIKIVINGDVEFPFEVSEKYKRVK